MEAKWGLNAALADTDEDGIIDGLDGPDGRWWLDIDGDDLICAKDPDSDGDGRVDGYSESWGYNPLTEEWDFSNYGYNTLTCEWEADYDPDEYNPEPWEYEDFDCNGIWELSNSETNAYDNDTDEDGLSDGFNITFSSTNTWSAMMSDPAGSSLYQDIYYVKGKGYQPRDNITKDIDVIGEIVLGSDPLDIDSDDDTISDGDEAYGYFQSDSFMSNVYEYLSEPLFDPGTDQKGRMDVNIFTPGEYAVLVHGKYTDDAFVNAVLWNDSYSTEKIAGESHYFNWDLPPLLTEGEWIDRRDIPNLPLYALQDESSWLISLGYLTPHQDFDPYALELYLINSYGQVVNVIGSGDISLTEIYLLKRGANPADVDTDGDGLTDNEEIFDLYTFPLTHDSDRDGLNDSIELDNTVTMMVNGEEETLHKSLDPLNPDFDSDGVPDGDDQMPYTYYSADPDYTWSFENPPGSININTQFSALYFKGLSNGAFDSRGVVENHYSWKDFDSNLFDSDVQAWINDDMKEYYFGWKEVDHHDINHGHDYYSPEATNYENPRNLAEEEREGIWYNLMKKDFYYEFTNTVPRGMSDVARLYMEIPVTTGKATVVQTTFSYYAGLDKTFDDGTEKTQLGFAFKAYNEYEWYDRFYFYGRYQQSFYDVSKDHDYYDTVAFSERISKLGMGYRSDVEMEEPFYLSDTMVVLNDFISVQSSIEIPSEYAQPNENGNMLIEIIPVWINRVNVNGKNDHLQVPFYDGYEMDLEDPIIRRMTDQLFRVGSVSVNDIHNVSLGFFKPDLVDIEQLDDAVKRSGKLEYSDGIYDIEIEGETYQLQLINYNEWPEGALDILGEVGGIDLDMTYIKTPGNGELLTMLDVAGIDTSWYSTYLDVTELFSDDPLEEKLTGINRIYEHFFANRIDFFDDNYKNVQGMEYIRTFLRYKDYISGVKTGEMWNVELHQMSVLEIANNVEEHVVTNVVKFVDTLEGFGFIDEDKHEVFLKKLDAFDTGVEICIDSVEACIMLYEGDYGEYDTVDVTLFAMKTSGKVMQGVAAYKGWEINVGKGLKPVKVAPIIGVAIDIIDYVITRRNIEQDEATDKIDAYYQQDQLYLNDVRTGTSMGITIGSAILLWGLGLSIESLGVSLLIAAITYLVIEGATQLAIKYREYDKDHVLAENVENAYIAAITWMNDTIKNWNIEYERSIPFFYYPNKESE